MDRKHNTELTSNARTLQIRTEKIEQRSLTVIRIPNNEIYRNFEGVCMYIDNAVKESLRQPAADTSL